MWKNINVDKCVSFIKSEFRPKSEPNETMMRPAITISRMTGSGGHTVASSLAEYLQARLPGNGQWTVFDRNLVEKVLEDHHVHTRIADYMKEGHKSVFRDTLEEWMGLHPSSWTIVQMTNATILRLVQAGNVIVLGRGGAVLAGKMKNVLHVLLVGSLDKRIERVEQVYGFDRKGAVSYVKKKDHGRRQYLKDNFNVDIDNPLLFHMVVNTDRIRYEEAARMIGDEVLRRFGQDGNMRETGVRNSFVHQEMTR